MKRIFTLAGLTILLGSGITQAPAATTNRWVQNVNIALTAYVPLNGQVIRGAMPTKQFLAFLSGITNSALTSSQTTGQTTNGVYTNLTTFVKDFWVLPGSDVPYENLPRSYTVTSDYVVSPDGGVTQYTNNIQFTNDLVVTRGGTTNVVYSFNNTVTVPTNRTAYLFPDLQAASLSAVWTNNGTDNGFLLSGWVITNIVSTSTNFTYGTNPDFTQQRGAKLLYVTPIVDGTNQPSKYVVRYTSGSSNVDIDVSSFMQEYYGNPYTSVTATAGTGSFTIYAFNEIDFDNGAGTSFKFAGFDTQVWGFVIGKGGLVSPSVIKTRKMLAGNYAGRINGKVQDRTFNAANALVTGTISFSGGKLE